MLTASSKNKNLLLHNPKKYKNANENDTFHSITTIKCLFSFKPNENDLFLKTMFLKPTFKTTNKKSPNSIFIFHIHIPYSYLTNILNEINNQNIN